MSRRVLVVQHDHVSLSGPVGQRFEERGYEVVEHLVVPPESFDAPGVSADFPSFAGFDAVVLLGAPWSAYDDALIGSWLAPEIEEVREADAAGVPVLGICFGGQLLARVHGGSVAASPMPEIGWTEVRSDDEGVVPGGSWFQWHYDRWETPPEAVELARNEAAVQAFSLRRNLALQFHPELTPVGLDGWMANGGHGKALAAGHDPDEIVRRTDELADDAAARARRLVDGFLDEIALREHPAAKAAVGEDA